MHKYYGKMNYRKKGRIKGRKFQSDYLNNLGFKDRLSNCIARWLYSNILLSIYIYLKTIYFLLFV